MQVTPEMIEAGDAVLKRADFSFWEKMEEAEGHDLIRAILEAALVRSKPDDVREALEPFAALEIPKNASGNAGFYSIRFSDIARAQVAITAIGSQP